MPILTPALIADCRSMIDAVFGPIPGSLSPSQQSLVNTYRQNLAICCAEGSVYSRDNNQVNIGQDVVVNVPGSGLVDSVTLAAITGAATGTGTVTTTGTYS
jgi:hypothetical protein